MGLHEYHRKPSNSSGLLCLTLRCGECWPAVDLLCGRSFRKKLLQQLQFDGITRIPTTGVLCEGRPTHYNSLKPLNSSGLLCLTLLCGECWPAVVLLCSLNSSRSAVTKHIALLCWFANPLNFCSVALVSARNYCISNNSVGVHEYRHVFCTEYGMWNALTLRRSLCNGADLSANAHGR